MTLLLVLFSSFSLTNLKSPKEVETHKTNNAKQVADVLFASFALVFIVTRNILFPVYVISSIPIYCIDLPPAQAPLKWPAFGALCILEAMHIYWAYLVSFCDLCIVVSHTHWKMGILDYPNDYHCFKE
jgi:hypothetical protein